jgi:hypothetical protein
MGLGEGLKVENNKKSAIVSWWIYDFQIFLDPKIDRIHLHRNRGCLANTQLSVPTLVGWG